MRAYFKTMVCFISIVTFISSAFLISCHKENPISQNMTGKLVSHSDCKSNKSVFADTVSCVEYSFQPSSGKLLLKHINSAFNCCPGEISCLVSILNDTITIIEQESQTLCNCDCIYDLDIEVNGVTAKMYRLKFIEPYLGDQEPLDFMINLATEVTGSLCVTRTNYPWF